MAQDTLTITRQYRYVVPIESGTIHATDLCRIKAGPDDFSRMTYDPAFALSCRLRSARPTPCLPADSGKTVGMKRQSSQQAPYELSKAKASPSKSESRKHGSRLLWGRTNATSGLDSGRFFGQRCDVLTPLRRGCNDSHLLPVVWKFTSAFQTGDIGSC